MKFMRVRFMRRNDVFFICNIYEFHMNFIRGKIGCVIEVLGAFLCCHVAISIFLSV